jgi:hypothetical protein
MCVPFHTSQENVVPYQTTALRALKMIMAGYREAEDTPLRRQLEQAINYDEQVDQEEIEHAIDYAMKYLARATRQDPAEFVPSETSFANLIELDSTYAMSPILEQAIEFMAAEMMPSALDRRLAAQCLRDIAQKITTITPEVILDVLNETTFDAFITEQLNRPGYREVDHPRCVRNAIVSGLTHIADKKIHLEEFPLDVVPFNGLLDLIDRAADMIDATWL